jgi:hypothetical protein
MATITAKLLVARSDKKDMLPAAADPKRDRALAAPAGHRALTSQNAVPAKFAEKPSHALR